MNKKRWIFVICCLLLFGGYIKLFYKTYNENAVTQSADSIAAFDVKRITNSIIWNVITTPSQWKIGSIFSSSKEVSWDDMVKMPDYIFFFHTANQPANAWYTMLEVKDKTDFEKGLLQYHFEQRPNTSAYFSKKYGIEFIQNGNKLLLGNLSVDNKYIRQVADELFVFKKYTTREILEKNVSTASHLSWQVSKNNVTQEFTATANFDKTSIRIEAAIIPAASFLFKESKFSYAPEALCAMGFTQPPVNALELLTDSAKAKISKLLNFNIDSLLLPSNQNYQLDITGIQNRVDSAISYTYDDDFNQVEKVVVNNVQEPSFRFTVNGDSVHAIYRSWKDNKKIEQTEAGALFTPIPFVKSYCSITGNTQLAVTSDNYVKQPADSIVNGIFFLNLIPSNIPASILKYLPEGLAKPISNVASIYISAHTSKEKIMINGKLNSKDGLIK